MSKTLKKTTDSKSKATNMRWTDDMDDFYIMLKEQNNRNRPNGTWSSHAYSNMSKRLFEAKDEVWEPLIEANSNAKKWKRTSIQHYKKLFHLFSKDRTNGEGFIIGFPLDLRPLYVWSISLFSLPSQYCESPWKKSCTTGKKLSLTDEEDVKLSLSRSKNLRRKEYIFAAKFLTRRALNVEAIGRTFKPLWRAKMDFKVREAGDHVLLFVFELEADEKWVLTNEPWTFNKHAVLLQGFDGSTPPRHLSLISHDGKDCDIWLARKDSGNTESHEYGLWLRATPFNPEKTPFIVVSGVGDGLGGNSKPSKTPTGTTARASELNTARPVSSDKDGADLVQGTSMETAKTEAMSKSESQNTRIPLNEIQEIDVALGKYGNCEKYVASKLFDTSHVLVDTSHVPTNSAATLQPSLPAHTQTTQEHAPHMAETLPLPASSTLRTWKKLARDNIMDTENT
nr:hypothetical protein CFP56_72952 [Quercus suber]